MTTVETQPTPTLIFQLTLWDKMRLSFVSLLKKINRNIEHIPHLSDITCQERGIYRSIYRSAIYHNADAIYRDPTRYYCNTCALVVFGEKRLGFARWVYIFETKIRSKIYTEDKLVEEKN